MKAFFSLIFRWVGWLVTALAMGLVFWSIYTSHLIASNAWTDHAILVGLFISTLVYTLSLFLVSSAWYLLVTSVSNLRISFWDGFSIFAITSVYRYIPSNIVHYVGRHTLLRRRGVGHAAAAWGTFAETLLILLASALVAILFGAPLLVDRLIRVTEQHWLSLGVVIGLASFAVAMVVWFLRNRVNFAELLSQFLRKKVFYAAVAAFLLYIVARGIAGVALWSLAVEVLEDNKVTLPDLIAVGAAAWTVGYITPGASAGLGVREAVTIAALVALGVPIEGATMLAIAFRLTTTFADLLFTASGWIVRYVISSPALSYATPMRRRIPANSKPENRSQV